MRYLNINGVPAAAAFTDGWLHATIVLDVSPPGARITRINAVLNPAKLAASVTPRPRGNHPSRITRTGEHRAPQGDVCTEAGRRVAAMRVDHRKVPAGVQAMAVLERAARGSTLEPALLKLVRIRASQINGCTYCLALHNRDARPGG